MSRVILTLIVPTLIKAPGVVMVVDSIRYCVNASRKEDKLQPKNLFQVEENGKEIQMFSSQHVASVPQLHLRISGKFIIFSCLFQKQTR